MAAGCTAQPQNANRLNQSNVFTTTGDNDQCAAALGNAVDSAAFWGGTVNGANRNVTANGLIIGNVALVALPRESQNIPVTGTRATQTPGTPAAPGAGANDAGRATGEGVAAGIRAQTQAGIIPQTRTGALTGGGVGTDDGMPLEGVTPLRDPTVGVPAGVGVGTNAGVSGWPTAGTPAGVGPGTAAGNRAVPGAGTAAGMAGTGAAAGNRTGTGVATGTRTDVGTTRYGALGSSAMNRLSAVDRVRLACPRVADIRVVNDEGDRSRLAEITAAVRAGQPITEFMAELTAITQRATSAGPGSEARRRNGTTTPGTTTPGATTPGTTTPGETTPGATTPDTTTPRTAIPGTPTPSTPTPTSPGARAGSTGGVPGTGTTP